MYIIFSCENLISLYNIWCLLLYAYSVPKVYNAFNWYPVPECAKSVIENVPIAYTRRVF